MMSLNKFMHPRNIYRDQPPDYKQLRDAYDDFAEHTTTDPDSDRVHVNFREPACLRALTRVLLHHDFDLDVELPLDRLIPTVPLRLNYILWLEDLLGSDHEVVSGIDIGTGASCIYPLLGARQNDWHFLATEQDEVNLEYAHRNVTNNGFDDQITVVHSDGSLLRDILDSSDLQDVAFNFCMCNPPFFASEHEASGALCTRSDDRPEPSSVRTAANVECVTAGGEVQFVSRLIAESVQLKDRVHLFTTMLGKKSSLAPVKQELSKHGITNVTRTQFCQGRTMRWAVAWTFDEHFTFPKPVCKPGRHRKKHQPFTHAVPLGDEPDVAKSLARLTAQISELLAELQVPHNLTLLSSEERSWLLSPRENTWTHQRRKRRLAQRTAHDADDSGEPPQKKTADLEQQQSNIQECSNIASAEERCNGASTSGNEITDVTVDDMTDCLFSCMLTLKVNSKNALIELQLVQGSSRELLHQLLLFLKNRLK